MREGIDRELAVGVVNFPQFRSAGALKPIPPPLPLGGEGSVWEEPEKEPEKEERKQREEGRRPRAGSRRGGRQATRGSRNATSTTRATSG